MWASPIWKNVPALRIEIIAQPVGFGSVCPNAPGWYPEVKLSHRSRALSGNGRNSPTTGTPDPSRVRLPITSATTTAIQATAVAAEFSRQRRTVESAPM